MIKILIFFLITLINFSLDAKTPDKVYSEIVAGKEKEELSLVIKSFDGKILFNQNNGNFDMFKPIPIASATKWITAAITMRILEQKKLSIDTPIGPYLKKMGHIGLDKRKYMITLRQLLSFQSGLESNVKCMYISMFKMNTKKCVTKILEKANLRDKAGFEYNGVHMAVLGYVLEYITGRNWHELVKIHFKDPFTISSDEVMYYGSPKHRRGLDNPLIAGGLVISTNDYLKFLSMLANNGMLDGNRYLSSKSVDDILQNQFPSKKFNIFKTPFEGTGANPQYALGNWVESDDINSSGGAFGFYPWIDKKKKYLAIYSIVSDLGEAKESFKIVEKVRADLVPLIIK